MTKITPHPSTRENSRVAGPRSIKSSTARTIRRFARMVGLSAKGIKRLEITFTECDHKARGVMLATLERKMVQMQDALKAHTHALHGDGLPTTPSALITDRATIGRFIATGKVTSPLEQLIAPA
jgi:hypothetical protein